MFRLHTLFANRRTALSGAVVCALVSAGCAAVPVLARAQTMTPAGTMIDNVAALGFTDQKTGPVTLPSNKVSLQVQEIVDVSVETLTPEVEVEPDTHNQRLAFRIRNLGNGFQTFDLSLSALAGDDFDPHSCSIIVDWDGDGQLDMTRDKVSNVTPELAPGQAVVVWVSCSIPAGMAHGALARMMLRASPSVLRNGTTGAVGNGGTYVVMGPNLRGGGGSGGGAGGGAGGGTGNGGGNGGGNGSGTDGGTPPTLTTFATFKVGQVNAQLIKTQTVVDVAGGSRAAPGSIVTYSLEAKFGIGANARNVKISDAIPAGSTYVPGSLTADGAALTDAEDGDAGRFAGGSVEVALGDVEARTSRTVTFKVRIDPLGSSQ
ncbi:DUF11 domain-containing protein [Caulobacter sp.]|uniref:DUF11 domain-containing protein n=1 Tax=Caulobacter sp. TaxID=78 RepID=UPI001B1E70FB|nr:DUF11 domain-containing protein [Caulobacter sp.]MBO9545460.1 DUF11 domain-containing protein [Caulobacter sp.]